MSRKLGILLIITLSLLSGAKVSGQAQPDNLEIGVGTTNIDGHGNAGSVRPGDTIFLLPGKKSFLSIRYLHGTADAPIVIIGKGDLVSVTGYYFGIKIDSCSHLKLSGRGVPSLNYGIKVYDINGAGLSIEGLSTDIEVEGLEISKTELTGIFAKSDPDCDLRSTRDKYTLRNLSIHDNYIHHTGMEGLYIGNTSYSGKVIQCNGRDTLVYPHLLKGVEIYNNRIERTGWDGIQVSSSDSACNIHDNFILYDSEGEYWNQMSGILAGGGSRCDCYNNVIKDGKGVGIELFTLGGQRVFNNLIVNAGRTYHSDSLLAYQKHALYIGNDTTVPGSSFSVIYNTIISPKNMGIKFDNLPSRNNIISNNIIINPGAYEYAGNNAYVEVALPSMEVLVENNLQSRDFQKAGFVDPGQWNFDLKKSSPAVNHASEVPGPPILFDILNRSRPFDSLSDQGAYECHDSSLIGLPELSKKSLGLHLLSPNPASHMLTIGWTITKRSSVSITLLNVHGNEVIRVIDEVQHSGIHHQQVDVSVLPDGFYFCRISTPTEWLMKKIIVLK